nr:hypothetical protein [Tanacetum cinerariifolium]
YGEAFPNDTSLDTNQDRENIAKTSTMPHEALLMVTSLGGGEGKKRRICSGGCSKHEGMDQGKDLLDKDKSAYKGSDSTDEMPYVLGSLGAANILASGGLRSVFTTASVATPTTRVTRSLRGVVIGSSSPISINIPSISKKDKGKILGSKKLDSGGLKSVFTTASLLVATASTSISLVVATASRSFPTTVIFTTASVATPTTRVKRSSRGVVIGSLSPISVNILSISKKDKGKGKMKEHEQPSKEKPGFMLRKNLSEYEQAAVGLSHDEKVELINELLMYQRHLAQIKKYQSQQNKPTTKTERRNFYMSILRSNAAEASGTEPTQEQQSKEPKELPEEELKKMMELSVPTADVYIAKKLSTVEDLHCWLKELKQIEADDQAIQTILPGLPKVIYAAVDSCETAQEIWLRVQQMMKGSEIGIQKKKAKLFNEWERFTSNDRESIESYYHRFLKVMNDLKQNKHFPEKIASNLKFLKNLQPEWSRHVTIVHQTKDLHTIDYTQLYDFLKYNQKERISSNPRNRQIAQPGMNMGQDRQIKMVGGNVNHNLNGNGNLVAARTEGNVIGHNARIQLQAEEFDIMAAPADLDEIEEVNANYGSDEVHNYKDCYDNEIFNMFTQEEQYTELLEPITESHQVPQNDNNVISEVTSVEQSGGTVEQHPANVEEKRTLYDSLYHNLAIEVEKVNTVNRKMKETNVELTTELARYKNQEKCFEISQEKYDKLERCYQKSVYQEQCFSKKINALYLSSGKQIMTLNEEISDLNKQPLKEKSTVFFLLEEKKKLKSDFKIHEDELLDKQIQLEKRIKELDNILVKTGQSIQTIHMLSLKPDSFYHTEQKMALGYQNPFYLMQAQQKQQSLYDGKVLFEKHDPPVVHDSEETLQLAQESRQKMKQLKKEIKPANYTKINHLSGVFVSLTAKLREELYFLDTSKTANVSKPISIPNEEFSDDTTLSVASKFVGDFKSLTKEADESLAKHKVLELEIKRLLRAVVSYDIMYVVQNNSVGETSNLQTELERTKERFENCIIKKENEYAKLWNDWYKKCEECKFDKISYDKAYNGMQQKIERLQAQLGDLKGKRIDNTKTRRSQPRSNIKNDRVPSASKSSCNKNKGVEVEEYHRNLLLPKNKKHMSSACNNVKLATQNVKSKVVCAMCKQCLIYVNHDVCLLNYFNGKTSCGKKQKANVSIKEKQKKQQPKVKKTKKVGFIKRLATPKPS